MISIQPSGLEPQICCSFGMAIPCWLPMMSNGHVDCMVGSSTIPAAQI